MTCPGLGVVVVLHGVDPSDSVALTSLSTHLRDDDPVSVVVQDNSERPEGDATTIPHVEAVFARPDNPGLADAYRTAAQHFSSRGTAWMVLLDQDSQVTREYLDEVLAVTRGVVDVPPSVSVLVPRLVDSGRQLSPHGRVRLRARPLATTAGLVAGFSTHLNSGSVVRLAAVRRAGGFPEQYPLDYLDHALSSRLREGGGRAWLLRSTLEHRLSLLDRRTLSATRLASILDAEQRYHVEFGSRGDLGWLAARSWAGAVLSTTRLRPSPDPALERRAAVRATRAVLGGPARREGDGPVDADR